MTLDEHLVLIGACQLARHWARGKTATEAWRDCSRCGWLLWWAFTLGDPLKYRGMQNGRALIGLRGQCVSWADLPAAAIRDFERSSLRIDRRNADVIRAKLKQPWTEPEPRKKRGAKP